MPEQQDKMAAAQFLVRQMKCQLNLNSTVAMREVVDHVMGCRTGHVGYIALFSSTGE